MKFTIELEEFWMDEDSEQLDFEMKKHITNKIVSTIYKSIEDKIEDQIARQVKEKIESTMYKKASLYMNKCFKSALLKATVYEDGRNIEKLVTLEEYVLLKFQKDSGWSSPNDKISSLAKSFSDKFAKEIKERYDLLFATQIVQKLDEKGLLKDNVAKLMMDK